MTIAEEARRFTMELADLGDLEDGRQCAGSYRRFHCPIHGGSSRTLSVEDVGENAGLGSCFNASCAARKEGGKPVVILDWPGRPVASRPLPHKERAAKLYAAQSAPRTRQRHPQRVKEHDTLSRWQMRLWGRVSDARVASYLAERGLDATPDMLAYFDIGYMPAAKPEKQLPKEVRKWEDRIIFPLWSPDGVGFAGRSLWGWQPGMDEYAHKGILDAHDDACEADVWKDQHGNEHPQPNHHRRWEKTDPAGWFCSVPFAETVYVVEGPFDRLALLSVGFDPEEVIAPVGVALDPAWLPKSVKRVVLALDGDDGGRTSTETLAFKLYIAGFEVVKTTPPDDGLGKDASERYRRGGVHALGYIFNTYRSQLPEKAMTDVA